MATVNESIKEPFPISFIAGRYLLFDINVVTYLRKTYNICGVLIGGIPQIPQQNVFLGLPLELLPEEVMLLVEKRVVYIVDAAAWHRENFNSLNAGERKRYLCSLKSKGRTAQKAAEENMRKKIELGQAKHALVKSKLSTQPNSAISSKITGFDVTDMAAGENYEPILLDDGGSSSPPNSSKLTKCESLHYTITLTTTYNRPSTDSDHFPPKIPMVPVSYALFAHLHSHNYHITPGLRFGCDYTVYPGDPLRFHSHFLAVGYDWDEEIPLMDLIGGGRLGTGVKKGFLIGGRRKSTEFTRNEPAVRTFCIEWGGM